MRFRRGRMLHGQEATNRFDFGLISCIGHRFAFRCQFATSEPFRVLLFLKSGSSMKRSILIRRWSADDVTDHCLHVIISAGDRSITCCSWLIRHLSIKKINYLPNRTSTKTPTCPQPTGWAIWSSISLRTNSLRAKLRILSKILAQSVVDNFRWPNYTNWCSGLWK